MIRKKKNLHFKEIRYKNWSNNKLEKRLKLSFLRNFNLTPINRLSFILQTKHCNKQHFFYIAQNKLQCLFSYSYSVPNKKIISSRFFLNKGIERLMYGSFQK